jgi:hypothetical protein
MSGGDVNLNFTRPVPARRTESDLRATALRMLAARPRRLHRTNFTIYALVFKSDACSRSAGAMK